jgi:hypothetical protein
MFEFIKKSWATIKSYIQSAYNKVSSFFKKPEKQINKLPNGIKPENQFDKLPDDIIKFGIAEYCDKNTLSNLSQTSSTNFMLTSFFSDKRFEENYRKKNAPLFGNYIDIDRKINKNMNYKDFGWEKTHADLLSQLGICVTKMQNLEHQKDEYYFQRTIRLLKPQQ